MTTPKESRKILALVLLLLMLVMVFSAEISDRDPVLVASGSVDSAGSYRWGLDAIEAPEVWDVTKGSPSIVVAVIDGGIDFELPALESHRWVNDKEIADSGKDESGTGYVDDRHGWDFRNDQPISAADTSKYFHGTFVAGLITSRPEPETGTGGVAPEIKLMDLRVLNSRGRAFSSDWPKFADAIRYATENGAQVINLSLSARVSPPENVRNAIREAHREGVLLVVSSGNDGGDVNSLGRMEEVLTVGAVCSDRLPASFSSHGSELDLMAPGEDVLSFKEGKPTSGSGTSFAAAHLSGSAALILSAYPDMTKDLILEAFHDTAQSLPDSPVTPHSGSGLVNLSEAFAKLDNLQS